MDTLDAPLRYRYPGVKPFTTEEQDLFFGRDKDTDDLFNLIFVKQIIVLYGKSGYGKSSLINAGIIPTLQTETDYVHFPIRFNNYSELAANEAIFPTDTVRGRLITALQGGTPIDSPLDALIPKENSLWYWLKTYQWQSGQTRFVFFFDQFEELFTYPKDKIDEFSEQLALLLYPSIPLHFRQRMVELAGADILKDAILYQKLDIKVVFSVRSDRLSLLNGITDRHPTILQNCYELDALNRGQANEAIIKPALSDDTSYVSPGFSYAPDAVEAILANIADPQDGKIESATLQIVCRYIEEELVAQRSNVVVSRLALGDITAIFQTYYEGILNRIAEKDRPKVQQLIEDELIASGRRNPLSETYIQNKFGIRSDLLAQLEKTSLLRKERNANGMLLYEVSHDTLINAIERVATSRRAVEGEARKKKLEQQIADERARVEHLQKLTKRAQKNEKVAKLRSKIAWLLVAIALAMAGIAAYFYFDAKKATQSAKQQAAEAKALYWASESDKLFPDQALRLLERAAMVMLRPTLIYERITNIVNREDQQRFIAKTILHQARVNSAQFSPNGKQIVTASDDKTAKIWDLKGNLLTTLTHQGRVYSAQFSPDGNHIVTVTRIKISQIWDLNGNLLAILPHKNYVSSAQFSPNGTQIITASDDSTAKIWSLNGNLMIILRHKGMVRSAQFSPDGNYILTTSLDKTAKIWDVKGRLLATLKHRNYVNSAQFSANGTQIITASDDSPAKIWNLKGRLLASIIHQENIYSAQFSPDGNRIVTAMLNGMAKIWDIKGRLLATLEHQGVIYTIQFSHDGNRISTASDDNTAKIWDLKGNLLTTLTHQSRIYSAQFSPDDTQIITASDDKTAKIWNLKEKLLTTLKHQSTDILAKFSPDGNRIVTISLDYTVKVWDSKGNLLTIATLPHQDEVQSAEFSPNGTNIITVSGGFMKPNAIKVWDLEGNQITTLPHQGSISFAQFSPAGNRIVTVSDNNTAKIWDIKGNLLLKFTHVYSCRFSPNGTQIITVSDDKTAKIWDLTGNLLTTLTHQGFVYSAQFSPDGKHILMDNKDQIGIWDLKGNLLATLPHKGFFLSVQFSPDGNQVIIPSGDQVAKIWDMKGSLLATLTHQNLINSFQFSPDGRYIVTASADQTVKIWYMAEGFLKWLKENNDKVPPLSEVNKRKYEVED